MGESNDSIIESLENDGSSDSKMDVPNVRLDISPSLGDSDDGQIESPFSDNPAREKQGK